MQATNLRYLILSVVLLAGAGLYAALGDPLGGGTPREPQADALYSVDPWTLGPQTVERVNTTDLLTRGYSSPGGALATLTLLTNQAPKLYAAGPEVPYLGGGYEVVVPPPELVPGARDGVNALIARQGDEQWLAMYAYGERRGLLGYGPSAWALAIGDGLLGRPNDYYKLYLVVRADGLNPGLCREVSELAHTLFPRIQAWYAAAA